MLSKEEIEKDNTFKISMPLITDEDIRKIDNNFENIVKEFTKSYVKEKDLVLAQYIMKKQQDKLDQLESDKQKLIEKLEKKIRYYEENDEILATSNDNYSDGTVIKKIIDEFKEILSILKGENQVTVK